MFDKLQIAENRYNELTHKLSEPDIMSDQNEYRKLMKEHSELGEIIEKYIEYKNINKTIFETKSMFNENLEKEMHDMVNDEIREAEEKLSEIKRDLKVLLLPKDPNDDRSVIVEIRGGAGGDEAALFAGVLFRMYTKYAERKHWTSEILDSNPTEIGGFKEVIFSIEAKGAYSKLKYESGVHRVQRVPTTESSGRIHTSTVTVAVLPEAEDVDVNIDPNDIEIDTYRASGAGGQHVNKTDSAIRITHKPSGLVVTCQDQRSQHKNKDKAMSILRARLFEQAQQQQHSDVASERKSQVGTGDRSERIRTYNFPQGRITDHRINLTLYRLEEILNGDLDELFETLITTDQSQRLSTGIDEE